MATSVVKAVPPANSGTSMSLFDGTSTSGIISSTHTQELVIALCGPIGSPLHGVGEEIERTLRNSFGYTSCTNIRLSDLIAEYASQVDSIIPKDHGFERITCLINAGNKLRERYGASVLAELAINKIRVDREREKTEEGSARFQVRRVVHIIDSIKNKEELELLRLVYRDMLYVVGVFAPLQVREANLRDFNLSNSQIYDLIDRDSGEESKAGQSVGETFPNSDFFLRVGNRTDSDLKGRVERFLNLILGTKVITPTAAETAMYSAAMASSNSACLSRQVGAAVTDSAGDILSVGWNDVPAFMGGLYTEASDDHRCWNLRGGTCFNDDEKDRFAQELTSALADIIPAEKLNDAKNVLRSSGKLKGLIEFSRAIHAEMHAILNAGKTAGMRMANGKLFVTTYPCHSCARHIIAAGITEVYFIEPYRKSLAIKLHDDAISENESATNKVRVLAYDGVAPTRYLSLFRVPPNSRKKDGKLRITALSESTPRLEKSLEALPTLEALVLGSLRKKSLLPVNEVPDEQISPPTPAA